MGALFGNWALFGRRRLLQQFTPDKQPLSAAVCMSVSLHYLVPLHSLCVLNTMCQKGGNDSVKVAVRCRPLSEMEIGDRRKSVVTVDQLSSQVTVVNPKARAEEKEKTFTYDTVFGCDTKQVDLYNEAARPIIEFVLEGYNGKALCEHIY